MPLSLPAPIAAYFTADGAGGDAVAACFTADAVVVDEGRTHRGREAIARWKADSSARYRYAADPVSIEADDARHIVTARVSGDFPGSPVDLRYAFTLAGDGISRLEITA